LHSPQGGTQLAELSIVIVNWNGRHLLFDCLSSLRNQSLKGLVVILVDNGSTDDSLSFVRQHFPEVRIIALKQNLGFAGGNNRGMESCSSEFLALLNNDAIADQFWAERLLAAASRRQVGIVASKVLLASDPGLLDSAGDGMTTAGVAYKQGHLEPADQYRTSRAVFGASGCAALLRRSMLEDIGLFDEDFFLLYEDGDLCFRAQLRGWEAVYAPEAVVHHQLNASIGTLSRTSVYYGQRNIEYLYFKNMPGMLLWKYLPAHLLNDLLACLYFSWKGRLLSFLRSKISFLATLPAVLRKRKAIQSKRKITVRDLDRLLERKWLRSRLAGK